MTPTRDPGPDTEEQARAGGEHVFEGWEYYCTDRAQHPRSAKSLTWTSIDHIAFFDAFRFVGSVTPRPLLMIVGREAVTSWMSVEAFEHAKGPKKLVWIDGANTTTSTTKISTSRPPLQTSPTSSPPNLANPTALVRSAQPTAA